MAQREALTKKLHVPFEDQQIFHLLPCPHESTVS